MIRKSFFEMTMNLLTEWRRSKLFFKESISIQWTNQQTGWILIWLKNLWQNFKNWSMTKLQSVRLIFQFGSSLMKNIVFHVKSIPWRIEAVIKTREGQQNTAEDFFVGSSIIFSSKFNDSMICSSILSWKKKFGYKIKQVLSMICALFFMD